MIKYLCIKSFFLDNYRNPRKFEIGLIVEKEVDMTAVFSYDDKLFVMNYEDFNTNFTPLSLWRESQINSILENVMVLIV